MQENEKKMCSYCAKWFPKKDMAELHEKGKSFILYYCMTCYPEVKENINGLPWKDVYTFYR